MKKTISILIFACSVLLWSQQTISLEEAINIARENNLTLQNVYYQKEAAHWAHQNSKTQFMPRLNLVYTGIYRESSITREIFPGAPPITLQDQQNHITRLQLEQVLFAGGRIYNAQRLLSVQSDISQHLYQRILYDTDTRVTQTYYMILQTRANIEVLNLHLSLCHDLKTNSEIMFKNGIGLETDVLQWDLRIIEIENQIITVENTLKSLEQAWGLVLGIPIIYEIPSPETVSVEHFMFEIREFSLLDNTTKNVRMNEFMDIVLENNIFLQNIARYQVSSRYRRNINKADFLPTLYLSANYELTNDTHIKEIRFLRDPPWQVTFNLSIPIFHGFRNVTSYRESENQLQAQGRTLIENRRDHIILARQAWFDYDSTVSNVMQNERHYNLAERTLDIIRNLHQQGMTTNIALTDAQNDALISNLQFINSIYEYITAKNRMNNFKHLQ